MKKGAVDFELENIVKEILSDIIKAVINVSHKIKCESCNTKLANLETLKRHMRKFHEPMKKEKKCILVTYVGKHFHILQS